MANKQAVVTQRFAEQFGLRAITFRNFGAVIFENCDYLKVFAPGTRWMELGSTTEGRVTGELLIVPTHKLEKLRAPSKKFEFPAEAFGCPIANFLWLDPYCEVVGGKFDGRLCTELTRLFAALPSDEKGWSDQFLPDFFELDGVEKLYALVDYLSELDPGSRAG